VALFLQENETKNNDGRTFIISSKMRRKEKLKAREAVPMLALSAPARQ
jgi:hypothetical protein